MDDNKENDNNDKEIVLLKLVNKILVNIGKDEIDDLTKFVDIDRNDIIKDINKETLIAMESELFPLFSKQKCNYYRKSVVGFVLNCLKTFAKDAGYIVTFRKKEKSIIVEGSSYRKKHHYYSIKKLEEK
jgi:nanoRNase/pAp phosphatase (c-di-AMP/oligoRNAs hydrolase)